MMGKHISAIKVQPIIGFSMFVVGLWLAWQLGDKIVANDFGTIEFATLGVVAAAVAISILKDWRRGFYMFLIWLLFEDLVRKYLGNNMAIYFGKDFLVGIVFIAFFIAYRDKKVETFKPPF